MNLIKAIFLNALIGLDRIGGALLAGALFGFFVGSAAFFALFTFAGFKWALT